MKRFLFILPLVLLVPVIASAQPDPKFKTGAKPSPKAKIAATPVFRAPLVSSATPKEFAVVPPKLSYWLNDITGICVTSQEAFSKSSWSLQCGLPQLFIPDQEVGRWAKKYGHWNGAMLTDVMDDMARDGFNVDGVNWRDGPYKRVNYEDPEALKASIYVGPVNIAIGASSLPRGAGNGNGWYAFAGRRNQNTDHCVALTGYGTAKFCFESLNKPLPAGVRPDKPDCYLLFTWGTIGVVDQDWLNATCTEAYVRNPTTPGQEPTPPPPPVPPVPPPGPTQPWVWLIIGFLVGAFVAAVAVFLEGVWRGK